MYHDLDMRVVCKYFPNPVQLNTQQYLPTQKAR
jgi:hypothetical protein